MLYKKLKASEFVVAPRGACRKIPDKLPSANGEE